MRSIQPGREASPIRDSAAATGVEAPEHVLPDGWTDAVGRVDEHHRQLAGAQERRVGAVPVEEHLEVGRYLGPPAHPQLAGLVIRRQPDPALAGRGEQRAEPPRPPRSRGPTTTRRSRRPRRPGRPRSGSG